MKRRLRKKRRLGEFREHGFEVCAHLRDGLSDADLDAFIDRWIDAVEAHHLAFGGGGGRDGRFEGFVTRNSRGSATEDDRRVLGEFLSGDADVVRHDVGPLVDAWR